MLKDFRSKKKSSKRVRADEVYEYGGLTMARYGRFISMKNTMSFEQNKEFKNNAANEFPKTCKIINEKVLRIQKLVQEFNPLILLQCGYFRYFHSVLGKISESEYGHEEIVRARMLDYIQSVIVSTDGCAINKTDFDEEKYKSLFNEVAELYNSLAPWFQIQRSAYLEVTDNEYDANYDSFYVMAEMQWMHVQCERYFVHDMPHLINLLSPHNEIFNDIFGVSIYDFLEGIKKIQYSLSRGLGEVTDELYRFHKKVFNAENSTELFMFNPREFTQTIIKDNGWENEWDSIAGRFLGFDLFDVEKMTGLPSNLLKELSWCPGENKDFFGGSEYAGWPLRLLPTRIRPFLSVNGKYYCFDLATLMDSLYRIVQRLIIKLRPDYRETWNEKQKKITEELPLILFRKILPSATIYQNVFYKGLVGDSGKTDWCETDGVIIFDDLLIVLEAKGGAFTYTPPTTDFDAYINSTKELIMKPATQAVRFLEYMNGKDEIELYNSEHHVVTTIQNKQFKNIVPFCVTLDDLTELAARSNKLKPIGIEISKPVLSVSINDLRVYADIFESSVIFAHYLEQRMAAAADSTLDLFDELDHLGLYHRQNMYVTHAKDLVQNFKTDRIQWNGYTKDLDVYYHNLLINPDEAVKPIQVDMKGYFKEVIDFFGNTPKAGICKAGSCLLNMGGEGRNNFNKMINSALIKQEQKKRIMPISFIGEIKLTIFCHQSDLLLPSINWMRDYTYARMDIAKDQMRMMLQLFFDKRNLLDVSFDFLSTDDIKETDYSRIKTMAKNMKQDAIDRTVESGGKIRRNDLCPCGSGLKYKRCCGG